MDNSDLREAPKVSSVERQDVSQTMHKHCSNKSSIVNVDSHDSMSNDKQLVAGFV